MAKFEEKGEDLFIDGKKVIRAWESYNGWYWFGLEKDHVQDSLMADGSVVENDQIWFGFVQGIYEEFGYFSEAEIKSLGNKAWEIPKKNLPFAGRRNNES